VCTFRKVVKNVEVKVDVKKGVVGCREKIDNRCVKFIQITISSIVII
jgi:hypothetical protein